MSAKLATLTKVVIGLLVLPVAFLALYTWFSLHWVYSTGERVGYIQKLSNRGYVCKTYEGELVLVTLPGTQAEKFYFTVRDENIVAQINATIGKRVSLTYEQHKWIPTTCFGDTEYFITAIKVVDQQGTSILQ